jgi:hypothetical protein
MNAISTSIFLLFVNPVFEIWLSFMSDNQNAQFDRDTIDSSEKLECVSQKAPH